MQGANEVRQRKIRTAEPLVSEPSAFEVEMGIEKLKRHISPGINLIPEELIKAGDTTTSSEIHKPINSVLQEDELPEGWKDSIIVRTYL
jgi:hypothetical protein